VLAIKWRSIPHGAATQENGRFDVRLSRGTIFSCGTYELSADAC
jgi:hypothetical protein